jgi:hypothetical protein
MKKIKQLSNSKEHNKKKHCLCGYHNQDKKIRMTQYRETILEKINIDGEKK